MNGESFHYADNIVQLRSRQWKRKGVIALKTAEKNSATRSARSPAESRGARNVKSLAIEGTAFLPFLLLLLLLLPRRSCRMTQRDYWKSRRGYLGTRFQHSMHNYVDVRAYVVAYVAVVEVT